MASLVKTISGLILLVASVVLLVLAWWLFQAGAPGAPDFPDAKPNYGQNSGTRLYLPASISLSEVDTQVNFRDRDGVTVQEITISTWKKDVPEGFFFAVLELREGARMDNIRYEGFASSTYKLDIAESVSGYQYIVIPLDFSVRGAQLVGDMEISAINSENSRTSFVSPKFGSIRRCASIPQPSDGSIFDAPPIDFSELAAPFNGPCVVDVPLQSKVSIAVVGLSRSATRIDYSDPIPAVEKDLRTSSISYSTDEADEGFRARASYVDINREASVQRFLFIAGILVGLAAACAPPAGQLLYSGFDGRRNGLRVRAAISDRLSGTSAAGDSNRSTGQSANNHRRGIDSNLHAKGFFAGLTAGLLASALGLLYVKMRRILQSRNDDDR